MADRTDEPSGFARVFAPLLGLLALAGLAAAIRGRAKDEEVLAEAEETPEGHPS